MDGGTRADDTPVHQALREALVNCLANAEYYGRLGLVIVKKWNVITESNPVSFRIEIAAAKSDGISDPRNGTMVKMFNLIDIGRSVGGGSPTIFRVWREQGWTEPIIEESSEPERTALSLSLLKKESSDKQVAIKSGDKGAKTAAQKIAILEYLTDHASAKCSDISNMLGVKDTRARRILSEMIIEETIVTEGGNRNRIYKLKS